MNEKERNKILRLNKKNLVKWKEKLMGNTVGK